MCIQFLLGLSWLDCCLNCIVLDKGVSGDAQKDLDACSKTKLFLDENDRDPYFDTLNIWV